MRDGRARMLWSGALIAVLMIACALSPALARNHALLIGVSEYENPAIRPLTGPRNDVILLWRHFIANGFEPADIRVLAEGLPKGADVPRAHGAPTRAEIMAGFRALADGAKPGDVVVVHFSGHGTTQPESKRSASAAPEAGDRDQVLLPRDTGGWDANARTIRNAIVDDEIGEALDAIRAKGATVWAIIDACHAGTVTRSGAVVTRGVQPDALGAPPAKRAAALRSSAPQGPAQRTSFVKGAPTDDARGKGPLIGFFAVDSWTEAIEREFQFRGSFAPGPGGGAPRFGVFTYHLVRALNSGRARTYRDLARIVSLDIAASGGVAQAPPPFFDGDLDRTLKDGKMAFARRFPASVEDERLIIEAGGLHGFDAGADVAIFDGPLDDAKRVGAARIVASDASRAIAQSAAILPQAAGLWTHVEAPAVALRYRVGVSGEPAEMHALVEELTRRAIAGDGPNAQVAIDLVANGERDMMIHLANGRLWLTPEGRLLDTDPASHGRSASLAYDGRSETQVAADLRRALFAFARAANLVRIASAAELAGGVSDDVQVVLERVRETDPARLADPRRECGAISRAAPAILPTGDAAPISHCDQVRIEVTNRGEKDLFIGIFYLNPTGEIATPVAEWRQNGCVAFSPARSTTPLALRTTIRTWSANGPTYAGLHRVLVFAIPRTQTSALNLCHLLQPDAAAARAEVLRNAGPGKGIVGLLQRIGAGEASLRSANPFEDNPEESSSVLVRQYTLDVIAPGAGQ